MSSSVSIDSAAPLMRAIGDQGGDTLPHYMTSNNMAPQAHYTSAAEYHLATYGTNGGVPYDGTWRPAKRRRGGCSNYAHSLCQWKPKDGPIRVAFGIGPWAQFPRAFGTFLKLICKDKQSYAAGAWSHDVGAIFYVPMMACFVADDWNSFKGSRKDKKEVESVLQALEGSIQRLENAEDDAALGQANEVGSHLSALDELLKGIVGAEYAQAKTDYLKAWGWLIADGIWLVDAILGVSTDRVVQLAFPPLKEWGSSATMTTLLTLDAALLTVAGLTAAACDAYRWQVANQHISRLSLMIDKCDGMLGLNQQAGGQVLEFTEGIVNGPEVTVGFYQERLDDELEGFLLHMRDLFERHKDLSERLSYICRWRQLGNLGWAIGAALMLCASLTLPEEEQKNPCTSLVWIYTLFNALGWTGAAGYDTLHTALYGRSEENLSSMIDSDNGIRRRIRAIGVKGIKYLESEGFLQNERAVLGFLAVGEFVVIKKTGGRLTAVLTDDPVKLAELNRYYPEYYPPADGVGLAAGGLGGGLHASDDSDVGKSNQLLFQFLKRELGVDLF